MPTGRGVTLIIHGRRGVGKMCKFRPHPETTQCYLTIIIHYAKVQHKSQRKLEAIKSTKLHIEQLACSILHIIILHCTFQSDNRSRLIICPPPGPTFNSTIFPRFFGYAAILPSVMVTMMDPRLQCRQFDSRPSRFHLTTFHKRPPVTPISVNPYRSKGGDALRLGR